MEKALSYSFVITENFVSSWFVGEKRVHARGCFSLQYTVPCRLVVHFSWFFLWRHIVFEGGFQEHNSADTKQIKSFRYCKMKYPRNKF